MTIENKPVHLYKNKSFTEEAYVPIVMDQAGIYDLDHALVFSIIYQESKGNPYASRYEPRFFARKLADKSRSQLSGYVPLSMLCSLETEKAHRATSWGLFQILGETARWFGLYDHPYLNSLVEPHVNISMGCSYFSSLLKKYGTIEKALRYWNGSPAYPAKVMDHYRTGAWKQIANSVK
jgi:soluble lytic murein transglycosylase-like protein